MQKSAYFFSDIHLGCNPRNSIKDRELLLLNTLDQIRQDASHIFLLGDVFEFWMEYRFFVPKEQLPFLSKLIELKNAGIEVHIFAGNHDFNLGTFFEKECGFIVHTDELEITLQEKQCFFIHGDGMAKNDKAYRVLKKVIRHPFSNFLFKLLHPDWGMGLAQFVGNTSRKKHEDRDKMMEEYEEAVRELIDHKKYDVVMHGHTHTPFVKNIEEKQYVNTGEWLFQLTYVKMTDGICELQTLDAKERV